MIDALRNVVSLSMTGGLGNIANDATVFSTQAANAAATAGTAAGVQAGESFASVLGGVASEAVDNLRHAEAASFAGVKGTMNTREVVDAVMQADQSLQTVMAVRDKVVSAFLDITKMQI
jgi:flagellar hook-basal body complex protein FliE